MKRLFKYKKINSNEIDGIDQYDIQRLLTR